MRLVTDLSAPTIVACNNHSDPNTTRLRTFNVSFSDASSDSDCSLFTNSVSSVATSSAGGSLNVSDVTVPTTNTTDAKMTYIVDTLATDSRAFVTGFAKINAETNTINFTHFDVTKT